MPTVKKFSRYYLTHFGEISDVALHLDTLDALIDQTCSYLQDLMAQGKSKEDITRKYLDWLQERGQSMGLQQEELRAYETINPSAMTVTGIMRYLSQG